MESQVRLWFRKHHINLKSAWMRSAVDYLLSKNPCMKETELNGGIMEQLLHSDLTESYEPPVKIPTFAKQVILPKQHLFQVLVVFDISRSYYEQYLEITNQNDDLSWFTCEEAQEDVTPAKRGNRNRMLRVELSDGTINLIAVLYGGGLPIDELTCSGTKILTRGRIKCRLGVIFLNQDNCQVLGGECDSLQKNRLSLLEERLDIKTKFRKSKKLHATQDGNKTISPFLVQKRLDGMHEATMEASQVTVNISRSEFEKSMPRRNETLLSCDDDHLHNEEADKSLDTIQCTPIIKKRLSEKFDDSHLFRVPALPSTLKTQNKATHITIANNAKRLVNKDIITDEDCSFEEDAPTKVETSHYQLRRVFPIPENVSVKKKSKTDFSLALKRTPDRISDDVVSKNKSPEDSIVPRHAMEAENGLKVQNTSCDRHDLRSMMGDDIATTRSHAKRSSKELEKAAMGTRAITDFMSVLGERPVLQKRSTRYDEDENKDGGILIKEASIKTIDKTSGENIAGPTRRSLYACLSKTMSNAKKPEKIQDARSISPSKINMEGHKTPIFSTTSDIFAANMSLQKETNQKRDSCVGTTPFITQHYPTSHHRFIEKRDVGTSPLVQLHKPIDVSVIVPAFKCHQIAPRKINDRSEATAATHELPSIRKKVKFGAPILGKSLPQPTTTDIPEKRLVHMEPHEETLLCKRPKALLSNKLTNELSPLSKENIFEDNVNDQARSSQFSKNAHPFDMITVLQYKTMEIYERRSLLADLIRQRKYWMLSKRVTVVPLCSKLSQDLRTDGDRWCLKILLTDESASGIMCAVSSDLLVSMLGFDVPYCKVLSMDKRQNDTELTRCKQRALDVMKAFIRLDIVFLLEVSRNSNEPPIIYGISQLCEATSPAQGSMIFATAIGHS